jgi:hypothetical protein
MGPPLVCQEERHVERGKRCTGRNRTEGRNRSRTPEQSEGVSIDAAGHGKAPLVAGL